MLPFDLTKITIPISEKNSFVASIGGVQLPEQLRGVVLDEEHAKRFFAYYDIIEGGNWVKTSISWTPKSLEAAAKESGYFSGPDSAAAWGIAWVLYLYDVMS